MALKLKYAKWFLTSVLDQNIILTVLMHNLKTFGQLKFQSHFCVPWTINF